MNQPKSIFRNAISPDKLSKQQRALAKQVFTERKGNYIFENNTKGDLYLPRPTAEGVKRVLQGGRFKGDDYYFQMVKTNELKYIEEIMKEEKLLTEQPPIVTHEGTVEHVVVPAQKPINEDEDKLPKPDVLLVDGVSIL